MPSFLICYVSLSLVSLVIAEVIGLHSSYFSLSDHTIQYCDHIYQPISSSAPSVLLTTVSELRCAFLVLSMFNVPLAYT